MTAVRYRRVTGFALVALVVIVITGSAVRLTESGLGCSDWPTCEQDQFVPDLEIHAMIEFVNRMITGIVSVAVILAVLASYRRTPQRPDLIKLSWGLVAGVLGQIVLGGIVVLSHLNPWLVLGHFLLSMVLVANAVVLHAYAGQPEAPTPTRLRQYRWPITALTALAIVIGTLVTGAGPHGGNREGQLIERLPLEVPSIARIHGISVAVLLVTVGATLVHMHRVGAPEAEQMRGRLVMTVLLFQAAIGYVQYFTGVPVLLVGAHVAGATLAWIVVLWFHLDLSPETDAAVSAAQPVPVTVS